MQKKYPRVLLKPGREASLLRGHPWVFSGAVASVEGHAESGDIAIAATRKEVPLALGFYNPRSDIIFRLLSTDVATPIDQHFWRRRIRSSVSLRQRILPGGTTACRLINAEGDGIPGLIVDRYGDYLVFSISTAGVEKDRQVILDAVIDEVKPVGIYERSEGKARQLEGLDNRIGIAYGEGFPEMIEITENNLHFRVDAVSGQKTGFFLDQRLNRELVERLSRQGRVLNCFSYSGAFSVYCIRGGAERVISVDSSGQANEIARWNLQQNGYSPDQHPILRADVFNYLRETDERFDLIILDPPAFARSKKDIAKSARGYKEINLQAVKLLREGGILATFSCSNYIDETLFEKIVSGAVRDAGKTARLLQRLGPGPDHPTNLAHPEGRYLKGLLIHLI
jgi:23S rRNA (cytosine1962-C5)-methyltransferase